ncbi:MAG: hypothetical protein GX781_00985 [Clostridiales bacterium]|nr:hypothetical protein [Clostridiales bacterium]
MKKRAVLRVFLMGLIMLICQLSAAAQLEYTFVEGEEWFPGKDSWTYHYIYRIPQIQGEDDLAQELNHYFDGALGEMTNLVLPMYAADPIMGGKGSNEVSDEYSVTCNNDDFFSVLLQHRQSMEGDVIYSLSSVVYAVSGEYRGESLTLRGLAGEIGESSAQLAQLVVQDVAKKLDNQDLDIEYLTKEFFPQTHFYADEEGHIVFYLQPGILGLDNQPVFFTYTAEELEALLT